MAYESDVHTTPPGAPDDTLLVAYLNGACSPYEQDKIGRWVAASGDAAAWMTQVRAVWQASKGGRAQVPDGVVLARVRACIARAEPWRPMPVSRPMPGEKRRAFAGMVRGEWAPRRRVWSSLAAVLLGVAGLVMGWTSGVRHIAERPMVTMSYATAGGQQRTITLIDGTTIILDAASRLEVPADYADGHRVVRLSGRALFMVSHHEGSPFTVRTGVVTTRVLGTTFMVRQYPTDTTTRVAVREGRVAVNNVVIGAARMIEVSQRGMTRIQPVGASPFMFAHGVLALDSMRLADAIPELDRWYNVDIQLSNPALGQRLVEGRFPARSPSDLTEVLEWMFDAKVVREGRILTLFPKAGR